MFSGSAASCAAVNPTWRAAPVEILGTARPGEVLQIRVEVNGRLGNLVQATGTVRLPDRVLLHADVTLAGQAAP